MKQFQMDGYVCGSIDERSTRSGKLITTFSVNSPERRKNQQTGEWESIPMFFDCQYWHRFDNDFRAAQIADKAHLVVMGEPRFESWEKDGQKRSKVVFNVTDLFAIEGRKQTAAPTYGAQPEYYEATYLSDEPLPF